MKTTFAALAASLAAAVALAAPAGADGPMKVGSSYVIRFEHLDLDQPGDRQALLGQIERSARKLCEGERPQAKRDLCAKVSTAIALSAVQPEVRDAIEIARLERGAQQQAQR